MTKHQVPDIDSTFDHMKVHLLHIGPNYLPNNVTTKVNDFHSRVCDGNDYRDRQIIDEEWE
jgi:hypothetical protein